MISSELFEPRPYTLDTHQARQESIARLLDNLDVANEEWESDGRTPLFAHRTTNRKSADTDSVLLARYTTGIEQLDGFRDHNFTNPTNRLIAQYKLSSGEKISLWQGGSDTQLDDYDAFYTRVPTAEDKAAIRAARMRSILPKIFNHLVTFGPFITGVENERVQRMNEEIIAHQLEVGATRPASTAELDELVRLVCTPDSM